jgi:hypothetical protein
MFKTLLSSLLGLLSVIGGFAQTLTPSNQPFATDTDKPTLSVSNPISGAVYQQKANGQAKLIVSGSTRLPRSAQYSGLVNIRASLQKLDLISGIPLGDTPIQIPITGGFKSYSGEVMVEKGWYALSVSGDYTNFANNATLTITSTRKVGVGEVFIIAGQSNAQGGFGVADNTQYMDAVRVSPDLIPEGQRTIPEQMPNSYIRIGPMKSTQENISSTSASRFIGPLGSDL